MIDTVMVVWTSGLWKRCLRTTGMLTLLFVCVCALSYLITTSRDKWSGLVISSAQSSAAQSNTAVNASDATATAQPAPVPTAHPAAMPYVIPVVLQNPGQPDTHSHKHITRTSTSSTSTYTPPTHHAAPSTSSQDPALNALQNLP